MCTNLGPIILETIKKYALKSLEVLISLYVRQRSEHIGRPDFSAGSVATEANHGQVHIQFTTAEDTGPCP